jgi:hypothetical protein
LLLSTDETETGTCIASGFSYSSNFLLYRTHRGRWYWIWPCPRTCGTGTAR